MNHMLQLEFEPFMLLIFTWIWLIIIAAVFFYLGKRSQKKLLRHKSDVSTHTMGLLALILGFSLSMAVDRFERRRELVVEEANAIGTAYLQSKLIKFPDQNLNRSLYFELL